jgi:TPR repeat protein
MNTSNKSDKNDDATEEVVKTPVEKDNDGKEKKPPEPKEKQETQDDDDNKGDECCICLEELPKDTSKFVRWTCCGQGMHKHCTADLKSMKMSGSCPLCRAKTPTSNEEAVAQLRPWVKKKKAWAQNHMAQMYRDGEGVKQSYVMAKKLYELAAQQGHADAMFNLGQMYISYDVEKSYKRAFEYFEQAADLGYAKAQVNLGIMYITGKGAERSPTKARELWMKAAAQGDENAIRGLKQLDEMEGRTKTSPNAIVCSNCDAQQTETHKLIQCPCHSVRYCNKECQKKHRKQHKEECRRLLANKKLKKEKNTMKTTQHKEEGERKEDEDRTTKPKKEEKEEEEGDECPICLENLPKDVTQFTRMTCCGNGIHKFCFKDMVSMKMAGTCPLCRAKTPTSEEETIQQLRPWVKKKKAWAQCHMAQKYFHGRGVQQSYAMARRLYELAAQQGNTYALNGLGIMHIHGEGVEVSYDKAFEYYERAAHLGDAQSQFNLGGMYLQGQGVERDAKKAKEWIAKSASQGNEDAVRALQFL